MKEMMGNQEIEDNPNLESEVVVKMRLTLSLNCCLVCDFETMAVLLLHDFKTKPLMMFCCTS